MSSERKSLTPQEAKKNLCDGFASLGGTEKRYTFVKYLSDEENNKNDEITFVNNKTKNIFSALDTPSHEFIASIAWRLLQDIKECSNSTVTRQEVLQHKNEDAAQDWHKDPAMSALMGDYDFNGTDPNAIGFKVGLYLKGEATNFVKADSKLFYELECLDMGCYNNLPDIPQEETPGRGEVAIWLTGKTPGAIHKVPDIESSRLLFLYDGDHFSKEHLMGVNNSEMAANNTNEMEI